MYVCMYVCMYIWTEKAHIIYLKSQIFLFVSEALSI